MKVKGVICAFILCIICVIVFFIVRGMYNKKIGLVNDFNIIYSNKI